MTNSEIKKMTALIGKASSDELTLVREAYTLRMKSLRSEKRAGFSAGDKVSLVHKKFGGKAYGIIEKVNRTRATVDVEGTVWTIPMTMLTKEVA